MAVASVTFDKITLNTMGLGRMIQQNNPPENYTKHYDPQQENGINRLTLMHNDTPLNSNICIVIFNEAKVKPHSLL